MTDEEINAQLGEMKMALRRLPKGCWWSVGWCNLTADATVGVDFRQPELAHLMEPNPHPAFTEPLSCDLALPATCAESLSIVVEELRGVLEKHGELKG